MKKGSKKGIKKPICVLGFALLGLVLVLGLVTFIYISDYYHATLEAFDIIEDSHEEYTIQRLDDALAFVPDHPKAGLIFYPGGKVEYEAYAPLMDACAKEDILCVLCHMTGNLAVLEKDAADGILEQFPEIDTWYIGGHSLGGAMAASYANQHRDSFDGLILLGAYSTYDISDSALDVLCVYGDHDGVMNRDTYQACQSNLPDDFTEVVIVNGNHAGFGSYGMQDGDGPMLAQPNDQIEMTVKAIVELYEKAN